MIKTILIGAAACMGAMADETHSTFGLEWQYTSPIPLVGQTMLVPDGCTDLMSFSFMATTAEQEMPYIVAAFDWSEEDQPALPARAAEDAVDVDAKCSSRRSLVGTRPGRRRSRAR